MPWLRGAHANPHSDHWHGQRAARAVEAAREEVANLLGAQSEGVIFTSGATEANNTALKGMLSPAGTRRHLWLAGIEHQSLLKPAQYLCASGVTVRTLSVSASGLIETSELQTVLRKARHTPGMVAISHGNSEIGTLQPLGELARIVHETGHLLHVDASQSAARVAISAEDDGCDLLCLSSHKLYGPAGIGALYVAPDLLAELQPLLHGGGQERGRRAGTVPTFLAVGFGVAARLAKRNLTEDQQRFSRVVETFLGHLSGRGLPFVLIGDPDQRLPGHLSLRFEGIDADDMISVLAPSLSASTGAACSAGELRASHVLRAIGLDERAAGEVVRITFGRQSNLAQASSAADLVAAAGYRILERSKKEPDGAGLAAQSLEHSRIKTNH